MGSGQVLAGGIGVPGEQTRFGPVQRVAAALRCYRGGDQMDETERQGQQGGGGDGSDQEATADTPIAAQWLLALIPGL